MATLWLIRHGETHLNAARVLQPLGTPLSERGAVQAQALGRRLAASGLAGLLSSDVLRARQTADAIAGACGLTPVLTPLLHERNFGDLRGLAYDGLGFDPFASEAAPPGGESRADFNARVQAAWREVLAQAARVGGPLAVVTHALVIREWLVHGPLTLTAGLTLPDRLANTAVTVVEVAPPHRVTVLNCTAHLDAAVSDSATGLAGG
jgi:broad specificity phosphatase PhoE